MALNPDDRDVFLQEQVAELYRYRPAYPDALRRRLIELSPDQERLLDLGCGPGKLAAALASAFQHVLAVDRSAAMLSVGRRQHPAHNILWTVATAEALALSAPVSLVTIGAAVHWFQHDIVFPKIAGWLKPGGVVAVVDGDGADQPAWQSDWEMFMQRWLRRSGKRWAPEAFQADQRSFERWLEHPTRERFTRSVTHALPEFIACQHSRATWSVVNMGSAEAVRFDAELTELLTPFVEDGCLRFDVTTTLTWGRVRVS